jgi:hypothetical protein
MEASKREEELRYWNSFSVHVWYEPLKELTFPSSFLSYVTSPSWWRQQTNLVGADQRLVFVERHIG